MNRRTTFTPQRYVPGRISNNDWTKYLKDEMDPPGFIVKKIDDKVGKGLFAERKFPAGSFLLEYHGELISKEEGIKRENTYPVENGSFLLYFKSGRTEMCIDATFSSQNGRFVNDGIGEEKNADLKVVYIGRKPHVVLFASKNICKNEEIRYDYGVKHLPWRQTYKTQQKDIRKRSPQSIKECTVLLQKLDPGAETCVYEKEDGTFADILVHGTQETRTIEEPSCFISQEYDFVATKVKLAEGEIFSHDAEEYSTINVCQENVFNSNLVKGFSQNSDCIANGSTSRFSRDTIFNEEGSEGTQNKVVLKTLTSSEERGDQLSNIEQSDIDCTSSCVSETCLNEIQIANNNPCDKISGSEVESDIYSNSWDSLQMSTEQIETESENSKENVKNFAITHSDLQENESDNGIVVHCIVIEDASSSSREGINIKTSLNNDVEYVIQEPSVSLDNKVTVDDKDLLSEEPDTSCIPEGKVSSKPDLNKKRTKPHRPCPYCFCYKSALSNHIKRKHADQIEVIEALKLPDQDRNRAFQLLKRKGIMATNMRQLRTEPAKKKPLLRERSSGSCKKDQLTYCSKCFGFFSKTYFHRHKRTCHLNERSVYLPLAVEPEISRFEKNEEDKFSTEILGPMYNDDIGILCKKDPVLIAFGRKQFRKLLAKQSDKYEDKKTAIRLELRRLGNLYRVFKSIGEKNGIQFASSFSMFTYENFDIFREAVENVTSRDDGSIKDGLRKDIGYSVKKVCKFLHLKFSVERQHENVNTINHFLDAFTFYWVDIFGEAEFSLVSKRQTQLRKPLNLPKQVDVKKLRDFTLNQIRQLTESNYSFIASSDYNRLRNLVVSRLTLFNARRGGEPCCLQISQWKEAENNVWVGESARCEDPLEKFLMGKFKIAYQAGKGGTLVDLLILDDCWEAIRKLCDPEIRGQAGVHPNNNFVFPHTRYSLKHVTGWTSVANCCSLAGLDKSINATGMRHYIATLYAGLDVKESERQTFYTHMGHSETINRNVYQSPLARQTIMRVGQFLHAVDEGTEIPNSSRTDELRNNSKSENCEKQLEPTLQGAEEFTSKTMDEITNNPKPMTEDVNLSDFEGNTQSEKQQWPTSPYPSERKYNLWQREDTDIIKNYFAKYILSTENLDTNKGRLPGVGEIKEFIEKHPKILFGLPIKERIKRLRSKIFNERKLTREKLRKKERRV